MVGSLGVLLAFLGGPQEAPGVFGEGSKRIENTKGFLCVSGEGSGGSLVFFGRLGWSFGPAQGAQLLVFL